VTGPSKRSYISLTRQRQASETRSRIAAAARSLLATKGYDAATIDEIARAAEVSPQTIYAIFRSKRGILAELIEGASFDPGYEALVAQAMSIADPVEMLQFAPRIARHIHDAKRAETSFLRGAGVVAPELAAIEKGLESRRYEAQKGLVKRLAKAGRLRHGLDEIAARDILWAVTGGDLYRMLVVERGWSSDRYQEWLGSLIGEGLLEKKSRPRRPR
jgi:AcrR family transcriptional regulator